MQCSAVQCSAVQCSAVFAQVLSSLHYREILLKDLNPDNVLLDSRGHVKLTYQCEWVSVDSSLSREAVRNNYCAPEVISAGDLTPAADWWSFGALLHLLYTGGPPASALPTGLPQSWLWEDQRQPPSCQRQPGEFTENLYRVNSQKTNSSQNGL